jgi:soluble lytic murein transglycosylase
MALLLAGLKDMSSFMNTNLFFGVLFPLVSASVAHGALTTIQIDKELKSLKPLNAFDVPAKKEATAYPSLARVKIYEVRKNFELCSQEALKPIAKSEIKEWLALTALQCSLADAKKTDLAKTVKALRNLKISNGPWKNAWAESWGQAHLRLIDDAKTDKAKQDVLDSWAEYWDQLSKDSQARWYEVKGLINVRAKKNDEAIFFLKQSNDLSPSKSVSEQLQSLLKQEGEVPAVLTPMYSQQEQEKDEQIQKALSSNESLSAQKMMIEALKDFPQGKYAKKYKDKVLEIYFSASSESRDEALKNLLQADAQRMTEWAQTTHRRLDYNASLALAEEALPTLRATSQGTSLLWMAGRSAHSMGKYEKANKYFDELIQKHSGTDEALEAQFRMGLIQYRQENYLVAASLMERLRSFGKDRYDLNAWYWQIRSLEKVKDAKAADERDKLIERFPFSYYGLRLKAEKNGGQIEFNEKQEPKFEADNGLIILQPSQNTVWKRFKILVQNGWILEAQQELSQIPQPATIAGKWKWVQFLSKTSQHQAASVLLNKLLETDSRLRHPAILGAIFPKEYSQWIEAEAQKYNLGPDLVRGLIRQESAFTLKAVSSSNALGLMQMIPPTAEDVSRRLKMKVQIPQDMYRPEINIPMGTFYISEMLNQFSNNVPMALGAYNAGPHRLKAWLELRDDVMKLKDNHSSEPIDEIWFDELPWTETSFYIKAILRNILVYRLVDKSPVTFKPVFWSDLVLKKSDSSPSAIVK